METMDTMDFGTTPTYETCLPAGSDLCEQRKEAKRTINLLKKVFPMIDCLKVKIKPHCHDFGQYLYIELRCYTARGEEYLYFIEENWPETWNDTQVREFTSELE